MNPTSIPTQCENKQDSIRMTVFLKFASEARKKFNNRFIYDQETFTLISKKFRIVCPDHGEFYQTTHTHLKSMYGCPKCWHAATKHNTEYFITRSIAVHGDLYRYDKTVYTGSQNKVIIHCNRCHRDFTQIAVQHLRGHGCCRCAHLDQPRKKQDKQMLFDAFFEKAFAKFKDQISYDRNTYTTAREKMRLTCKDHGVFYQSPALLMRIVNPCPVCAALAGSMKPEEFELRSTVLHDSRYEYVAPRYVNALTKIGVRCKVHDFTFLQSPGSHLRGSGCELCRRARLSILKTTTTEEFRVRGEKIHGNKYDYTDSIYIRNDLPVKIICRKHGAFYQTPASHIGRREGCPYCKASVGENAVARILDQLSVSYRREFSIPNNRFKYDFYLPDHEIFIEFHGIQHFEFIPFFHKTYDNFLHRKLLDEAKEKLVRAFDGELIILTYKHLESDTLEETLLEYLSRFNVID